MRTEDILFQKKYPWKSVYNRGNILLVLMILGALGGTRTTYTFVYLGNHNREKERLVNDFFEKRLILLAHLGYSNLQTKASDNSIVPVVKEGALHFFDTQSVPMKDLGEIDACLDEGWFYKISADFDKNSESFPKFKEPGSRLSLDEFMELDNASIESSLNNSIYNKNKCALIKQRWAALKDEGKPLPIKLFHPLLTGLKLEKNRLTLSFFNPYDRSLNGLMKVNISLEDKTGVSHFDKRELGSFNISEVKDIIFDHKDESVVCVTLGDSEDYQLKINNQNNITGEFNLRIPKLTDEFWTSENSLRRRITASSPWRSISFVADESVFWRSSVDPCEKNTVFFTKTWIERLNACFFFNDGLPYEKIGNFTSEKTEKLNELVWNQWVADKGAEHFNFNGPESYIRRRMKELFEPFMDENSIEEAIRQTLDGQIFVDAISFIKNLGTIPKIIPYLYMFKNLQARPDVFSIEALMKDKNQKRDQEYILNVRRKFINSEPVWQKQ